MTHDFMISEMRGYIRVNLFKKFIIISILFILFICSGCAGKVTPSFYINQNIDFSFIKKVAVLPLDNLTNDKFASDSVRQVVISELLASGLVEVTVPGDAVDAIEKLRLKPGQPLNAEDIKLIGKSLKVQAVILGSVNKFGEVREGNISAPEVSITLMMADTSSGSIIWSVTETRGGASFWARHFGARAETMSEVVLKVVRKALQTLYNY
jgi:TolB-like protein